MEVYLQGYNRKNLAIPHFDPYIKKIQGCYENLIENAKFILCREGCQSSSPTLYI